MTSRSVGLALIQLASDFCNICFTTANTVSLVCAAECLIREWEVWKAHVKGYSAIFGMSESANAVISAGSEVCSKKTPEKV